MSGVQHLPDDGTYFRGEDGTVYKLDTRGFIKLMTEIVSLKRNKLVVDDVEVFHVGDVVRAENGWGAILCGVDGNTLTVGAVISDKPVKSGEWIMAIMNSSIHDAAGQKKAQAKAKRQADEYRRTLERERGQGISLGR